MPVAVNFDPERARPADASALVGDPGKFVGATGWHPTISLEQTLSDLLDDWRQRVGAAARS